MSTALWIVVFVCGAAVLYIVLLFSGVFRKKYQGGPHYFSTFGIILKPIRLSEPISETEAQRREKEGIVYYIGYYDDAGDALTVEKRRNFKTDFKYTYVYENRRLVKYTLEKAVLENGRPLHYRKTPEGSWVSVDDQSGP